jgi:hypothetical protein
MSFQWAIKPTILVCLKPNKPIRHLTLTADPTTQNIPSLPVFAKKSPKMESVSALGFDFGETRRQF